MDMYKYMINLLPPLYRTENTLKRYKIIGELMNKVSKRIDLLSNLYVIDTCKEEQLYILGDNVSMPKPEYMSLEEYRSLVKLTVYYNLVLVPTRNDIFRVIKKATGLAPEIKPLWTFGDKLENDHGYYIAYDLDLNFNTELLLNLEKLIGAGIKIKRDYFYRMQGQDIYPAMAMLDKDILTIECEREV